MNKELVFLLNPGLIFFLSGMCFLSFITSLGDVQVWGLVDLLAAVYLWHKGNAAYNSAMHNVFAMTILDIAKGKLVIEKKPEGVYIRVIDKDA